MDITISIDVSLEQSFIDATLRDDEYYLNFETKEINPLYASIEPEEYIQQKEKRRYLNIIKDYEINVKNKQMIKDFITSMRNTIDESKVDVSVIKTVMSTTITTSK